VRSKHIPNSKFIVGDIPEFNPVSQYYERLTWWKEQKRRCIEGYWVDGKWCPGVLYFYINFWNIEVEAREGSLGKVIGTPWFRDLEWDKGYVMVEARGFSGFTNDDEYTCNIAVLKKEELHNDGLLDLYIKNGYVRKQDLSKEYVPAREYLRKIHKGNLGKPLFQNEACNVVDLESRGGGKDLKSTEVVYTETGKLPISKIKVGDRIFGADGKLTTITSRKDFYDQQQYRVVFSDGRSIECGGGHLWTVYSRSKHGYKKKVLSLDDIRKDYKIGTRGDSRYFVQLCQPLEYSEKELPIDPYYLGLWLGDGNSNNTCITSADEEIKDSIKKYAEELGMRMSISYPNETASVYRICELKNGVENKLITKLKQLNVLYNKHIPDIYLHSSKEQRLELLRGLMDSDGYADERHIELTTSYKGLQKTIPELIHSLGIRTKIRIKKTTHKNSLRISLLTDLRIFKLTRKLKFVGKNRSKFAITNRTMSAIREIIPTTVHHSVCISVDNTDSLFVAGEGCIVTHNSFWGGGNIGHNFLFDGAIDYDVYLSKKMTDKPLTTQTLVGAIDSSFSKDLLAKFKLGMKHLPGAIEYNNETYPSPLSIDYTGSLMPGKFLVSTATGSKIHHRSFKDNPLAANGTRPSLSYLEEVGFMDNIEESLGAMKECVASGERQFGSIYMFGTGGLFKGMASMHMSNIFYNPSDYNCLEFDDEWEGRGKIGYFIPAYRTLNGFKETEDYITNDEKALNFLLKERKSVLKNKIKYASEVINRPIKPSEIFFSTEGTFFPLTELKQSQENLLKNDKLLNASWKGFVVISEDDTLIWKNTDDMPITQWPYKAGKMGEGCIEIFEMPVKNVENEVVNNIYIAGCDPVDDDGFEGSLQSSFIMNRLTGRIVAEYTARHERADQYYENLRKLLLFFNAKCNYENNKKGLFQYFHNMNCSYLLSETPKLLRDQGMVRTVSIGNKSYGTPANQYVNRWARDLIKKWLLEPAINKDNNINADTIRSIALIEELIRWTDKGNFDRVSALGMLMILKEEKYKNAVSLETTHQSIFNRWSGRLKKKGIGYKKAITKQNFLQNN